MSFPFQGFKIKSKILSILLKQKTGCRQFKLKILLAEPLLNEK